MVYDNKLKKKMRNLGFLMVCVLALGCNSNKVSTDNKEVKKTETAAEDFKNVAKPKVLETKVLDPKTEKVVSLEWLTDVQKATDLSIKTKKPLLMFFTGSDWCGWCTRLQDEVLKTQDFAKWASKNVILVELDFPKRTVQDQKIKDQNMQLAQVFKISGFPTIHLVTPNKTETGINLNSFGSFGYVAGGPSKWITQANAFMDSQKTK
jgi:protein disulfide-isomerase